MYAIVSKYKEEDYEVIGPFERESDAMRWIEDRTADLYADGMINYSIAELINPEVKVS